MTKNIALPITDYLDDIIEKIADNTELQVTAATGSGKSIFIIAALAKAGYRVMSSVPTRLSATSLSSYLAKQVTCPVGHAAEGKSHYDSRTQVVYATSGHVRRKCISAFNNPSCLTFCDILVLDEVHSGSMDNTMILSLWMYAKKMGLPHPKLLLLSATPAKLPVAPPEIIIPIPTRFPLEIVYITPDLETDNGKPRTLYEFAVEIIKEQCEEMEYGLHSRGNHTPDGDILVFAPGAGEVEDIVDHLRKIEGIYPVPAYANLDSEELQKIYERPPLNARKVIVATNIAESSITIDGVTLVVDLMQSRELVPAGFTTRLETCRETKDSAKQRAGRAGRTCPGKCIRLISEEDYELLDDHRRPDVERLPLHNVVMELISIGLDPVETLQGASKRDIRYSIDLLVELELITAVTPEEGSTSRDPRSNLSKTKSSPKYHVTDAGKFAPSVPLDVKTAAFLWRWLNPVKSPASSISLYQGVVVACLIDGYNQGYFSYPRRPAKIDNEMYSLMCYAHTNKYYKQWIGDTHLHTLLNAWSSFIEELGRYHYSMISNPQLYRQRKFIYDNKLNYKQWSDTLMLISQTYTTCAEYCRARNRQRHQNTTATRSRRGRDPRASKVNVADGSEHQNAVTIDLDVGPFDVKSCATAAIEILQSTHISCRVGNEYKHDMYKELSKMQSDWRFSGRVIALGKHEFVARNGRLAKIIDFSIPYDPSKARASTKFSYDSCNFYDDSSDSSESSDSDDSNDSHDP